MSVLFLDTSALVKRYVAEKGSIWIAAECHPRTRNIIVISQATLVEAVATFCRKARETDFTLRITPEERDRLISTFRQDITLTIILEKQLINNRKRAQTARLDEDKPRVFNYSPLSDFPISCYSKIRRQ
jgi:predicted nucleic acid-binding protein